LVRRWIIAVMAALAALVAGCSVALKFTYNQGPTLMYWWMDNYVDFDDQQKPRVKQLISAWFDWNRRNELDDYARLLQRAGAGVLDPVITPEQMCAQAQQVKQRVVAAWEQAVPSLAEVAVGLSAEQAQHIEKRFDKNNAKFRDEFLQPRHDDRVKARVKKVEERYSSIYGSVEDAQRERIAQLEAASPYDPERWLQERQTLQQEVMSALRSLQAARDAGTPRPQLLAQAQAALRQIGRDDEQSPRPAYRALQQKVWDYNCSAASQMHATMSPRQREFAHKKFSAWEEDVRALQAGR
jgi:hypothetical protein